MIKEIKLTVDIKNIETVLTILNSLKTGLITNIETDAKVKISNTQYKPKTNTIITEENSGTNDTNGKYMNPAIYKQRLRDR